MIFSCWEETIPAIPPRSQLYSLTPLNLGTSSVESLTSYACRLASEHHVRLGTLVQYIIAPRIDKPYITTGQGRSISSFLRYAVPVNGNGLMASDWVSALQSLTLREDLSLLTLLIGANALSHRDLLQPVRQWCSMCYNEWQQLGALIYEPLLWSINGITACPEHGQRLDRRCPYCSSSLPLLTWCSRPGYCSSCGRWLGKANRKSQVGEKEMYIAETVGEFLAYMPQLSLTIPREGVIHSLQELIAATTDGNMAAFSRNLGLPKTSLWELVHGHFPPSLPFLLHLCYQCRLSLLQLLIDVEPVASDKSPLPEKQIQRHDARGLFDHGKVQQTLEVVLSDQHSSPLSMRAMARQLGYPVRTIETYFPAQCREISRRYSEYRKQQGLLRKARLRDNINEAARIALLQGDKLTYQRVGSIIGKPGCFREYEARMTLLDIRYRLIQKSQ
jgi:TniQ